MRQDSTFSNLVIRRYVLIENCVTLACSAATVLGLYAMSSSWHSLWGLVMLCNISVVKRTVF